jgi:hypothetical protein
MSWSCPSGCGLTVTWSGCCDNDPSSNIGRHAPPSRGVCKKWLLIIVNSVDVAFM